MMLKNLEYAQRCIVAVFAVLFGSP